jgi:aromatic-L-amino-acid/L-tryptophan decarboxylase
VADRMHRPDVHLIDTVLAYLRDRLLMDEAPLDFTAEPAAMAEVLHGALTDAGKPVDEVLALFAEQVAPFVLSTDSPRFLAFIPAAPTKASLLFDAVVSASSMQGISWLESAGAVAMEEQVIRWLADLAGMPASAAGTFVSGGTAGNLSALTVAREVGRRRVGDARARVRVAVSDQAHSSIEKALMILDVEPLIVPTTDHRLTGRELQAALDLDRIGSERPVVAVVATTGTTNAGIVDEASSIAAVAQANSLWFHVDAAYGGAALLSRTDAHLFDGVGEADSFVTDPHKWWFSPYDCAALIWRDPAQARAVMTQDASYLDVLHTEDLKTNPSDLAFHLTRRARGLALWFSLAVHGEDAYRDAVQSGIDMARWTAEQIRGMDHVELVREPSLSIVMWRRIGWHQDDYRAFQDSLLEKQIGFVTPSSWMGETIGRFAFLNPRTTREMVLEILEAAR